MEEADGFPRLHYGNVVFIAMPSTPGTPVLREFELLVLMGVLSLGNDAYPLAIGDAIEKRTGRKASRQAVLITLERLKDKGLLTSYYGKADAARGGRPKHIFEPRPKARKAVEASLERIGAMAQGLDLLWKPRQSRWRDG
jgi:DNA-binding PadR family transcriptional regulator